MAKSNLRKGDLEVLEITEHVDSNKRFVIIGTFKGSPKKLILARVGEGADDPRDPEVIKMTADSVGEDIRRLYQLFASTKARAIRDGADPAEFPALGA